jgi:hypothetical protein
MVNHVRLKRGSGPAALSFRALNEKAPNFAGIRRVQGGGRFGSADASGKIVGNEIGGLVRLRLACAALVGI